jgi:hypothetical protein
MGGGRPHVGAGPDPRAVDLGEVAENRERGSGPAPTTAGAAVRHADADLAADRDATASMNESRRTAGHSPCST